MRPADPLVSRVGLLSDSHGAVETTLRAARLLLAEGAELLLHLGDLGTLPVIDALGQAVREGRRDPAPVHLVLGNVDVDARRVRERAESLGIAVGDPLGRLLVQGKTLVFLHGHSRPALEAALAAGPDYLCHGHSHRLRDERVGRTRVINPGALFRARSYTVGLLDPARDDLRILTVPR